MSQEEDYYLRPFELGDEVAVIEHLKTVFNGWPGFDLDCSPVDHWKWKYLENPYNRFVCSLAFSNGKVIASHHHYPFNVKVLDTVYTGSNAADFAVNVNFRRRGISKKVSQLTGQSEDQKNNFIGFWMSMNPIILKTARAAKRDFLYDIIRLVKIKDVDLHLKKRSAKKAWLKKIGYSTISFVEKLRTRKNKAGIPADISISTITSFDERFLDFWNKIKKNYSFILERTPDYLNWRYCDRRASNFRVRAVERDNHILGYITLRINKHISDYPEGYIMDLLTLPDSPTVSDALISDALHFFEENNINVIRGLSFKDQPFDLSLRRHGFLESPEDIGLFYSAREPVMEKLMTIRENPESKVHYVYGDID